MTIHNQLTIHNHQPFFEQALQHGVLSGIITRERVQEIINEAPQGIVQIAGVFGNKNLRPSIEEARIRIVNLVSLYLQATCEGDLDRAALSLQNQSILAHSR